MTKHNPIDTMDPVATSDYHHILAKEYPTRGGYTTVTFDVNMVPVHAQRVDERGRIVGQWVAKDILRRTL